MISFLQSPKLTHQKHIENQKAPTCLLSATKVCTGWSHERNKSGRTKSIQQFKDASGRIHKYCNACRGVK